MLFLVVVSVVFLSAVPSHAGDQTLRNHEARVLSVHDGDTVTLRLEGKDVRTRLIGIDAPEMGQRPWGRRAKKHLIEIIRLAGGQVRVETDMVRRDKYDRLLAYLWTGRGEMINEQMVRDGYAVLFTIAPNVKYAKRIRQAEREARKEQRGIWARDGLRQSPLEYKKAHPRTGGRP